MMDKYSFLAKIMNILLSGGAGFIGTNILKAMLDDDRISFLRVIDDFLLVISKVEILLMRTI